MHILLILNNGTVFIKKNNDCTIIGDVLVDLTLWWS
jgi:hypothetical protein